MSGLDDFICGREEEPLLRSLIEGKELEKWQRYFCSLANVFICCVDSQGNPLTGFEGEPEEVARIKKIIDGEQFRNMLQRVSESTLEDQAVETTAYPNVRIALISSRIEGKPVINWLVCGVLEEADDGEDYENPPLEGFAHVLGQEQFLKTLDTLRNISDELLSYKQAKASAEADSKRSRLSEREIVDGQKRTEALTEVIQLLENGESAENIILRLLKIAGELLDLSAAAVYRLKKEDGKLETVSKWCGKKITWELGQQEENGGAVSLLRREKTLVLSGNSLISPGEKEELSRLGLKAAIIMPVTVKQGEGGSLYACFGEMRRERAWKLEEIKFLNDTVKILQSILTRRTRENTLSDSNAALEAVLDHVGSAVYVRSLEEGKVLFANKSLRQAFSAELQDKSIDKLLDGWAEGTGERREVHYPPKGRWYDMYYTKMKWVDGTPSLLWSLSDITERKDYEEQLEQQVYVDYLTGLHNRMRCEKDLGEYVKEAAQSGGKGVLLYLDLDDFKHINDGLGHQYGDLLIKAVAHNMQHVEEIADTCYRMGGDEFVIIVPPGQYGNLDKILAGVRKIFDNSWFLKDTYYYCTASMGTVEFPTEGDVVHELIKKADIAMYEAKRNGKNRTTRYSGNMDSLSEKRLDMEKNMRDATAKGYQEFKVYYQPVFDIRKEGQPCIGAEALIRWNNAKMGFMSPAEFIPLAEYLGLINPIGNFVLLEACKNCRKWNKKGYTDYKVSVNLSVVQLMQPDIVENIEHTIKETGITPGNLVLEVTESQAANDRERVREILSGLKKLGVGIALDDFGTGYSSLSHVKEFPVDCIKVDQCFVKDLERDAYARSFIKMVSDLAENIGVDLCVEGVETQKQYEILAEIGTGLVQGYYFAHPMEQEEFEKKYVQDEKKEEGSQ